MKRAFGAGPRGDESGHATVGVEPDAAVASGSRLGTSASVTSAPDRSVRVGERSEIDVGQRVAVDR